METVTGYEQQQTVTPEAFDAIDVDTLDAGQALDMLDRLQPLDVEDYGLAHKINRLAFTASDTEEPGTIDRIAADLRRLGYLGTHEGVPDRVFDGDQLVGNVIKDPHGSRDYDFGRILDHLRSSKTELVREAAQKQADQASADFDSWLDRGLHGVPAKEQPARLGELLAVALNNKQLDAKVETDVVVDASGKKTGETHRLVLPDNDPAGQARLSALEKKAETLGLSMPDLLTTAVAAKVQVEAQAARAQAHEERVRKARETSARAEMDRLFSTPRAEGGYAEDAAEAQHAELRARGRELGVDLTDRDQAYEEALRENREQRFLENPDNRRHIEHLNNLIKRDADPSLKAAHEQELAAFKRQLKEKAAAMTRETVATASEVRQAAREREEIERRFDRSKPDLEERAAFAREEFGIRANTLPDWTEKKGGLFRRKAGRGPKVIEEGYVSPDNPHVMLVERRLRSSGELISQTVYTTRKAAVQRGTKADSRPRFLPPRNLFNRIEKDRQQDKLNPGVVTRGTDYVTGWSDYLPFKAGKSYDRQPGRRNQRRSRSWILSWFGI